MQNFVSTPTAKENERKSPIEVNDGQRVEIMMEVEIGTLVLVQMMMMMMMMMKKRKKTMMMMQK